MSGQAEAEGAEGESKAVPASRSTVPLPAPEESTTTAPYVFDPAASAAPEIVPEPAPPAPEKRSPAAPSGAPK